ncbi:sensor domain-containing diguanylate cyclase [Vibrio sp. JPW-9-11-11]|uniref:sensor domain-containing diguanylate cyclase n=1 Tax=Vibrio sp. JPW-9-11-11 TaxID=1416532 RepID=UPI0020CFA1D3|nr:diguanylate cyclase [Vibrio sp. JPW-9-11-11]
MASVFVACYLLFRYFWVYDNEVDSAIAHQQEEVQRVKTVLNLEKSELASVLMDYASWDDVGDFIRNRDERFLQDSLNAHTFLSNQLSGAFIFDSNVSLVWGELYDYVTRKTLSYDQIRYQFGPLLADSMRSRTDFITPYVTFIVLNGRPALVATSRVCNSEGYDCTQGYMMFIKTIGTDVITSLRQATGLKVDVIAKPVGGVQPSLTPENVSILEKLDFQNKPTVCITIQHRIKIPPFITWSELSAVIAFALFMFVFNLAVAHLMVQPLKRARQALENSEQESAALATEQHFISFEVRDFVCRVDAVISQLKSNQRELEWLTEHDPLTLVGNRRSLHKYWQDLLDQADHGYACVILVDVDYFKPFNDHYGHVQGDQVLRQVAKALKQAPSECEKCVARFGGEEFCVVLNCDSPIDAKAEGECLRQAIEQMQLVHHYSPIGGVITVSVGVADMRNETLVEQQDILRVADQALYRSKQLGRNCVEVECYQ